MFDADAPPFFALLDDVWALKGQTLTAGQKALFFGALSAYPASDVHAGVMAHVRDPKRGVFLPMPADVIAQMQGAAADDGRPGAEEAWLTCYRASDEAATVVWCAEMAEAYGIALPLLQAGDEVGARMGFKEVYTRLVGAAREHRTPPSWSATLGTDDELRDRTLLPHVAAGRIGADMLRRPELAEQSGQHRPALGLDSLLALPAPADATPQMLADRERARAAMNATKANLLAKKDEPTPRQIEAQFDRDRLELLKAESAGRLREYVETQNTEGAQ